MVATRLGVYGAPVTAAAEIGPKPVAGLPPFGTAITYFDIWRPLYGGASVLVIHGETTEHAPLYADPSLTIPLPNPQALLTLTGEDGTSYGRWQQPVYTYVPYRITVDEADVTSISRPPLYFIDGQDVSGAIAASSRGARLRTIEDIIDGEIYAEAFGSLAESNPFR